MPRAIPGYKPTTSRYTNDTKPPYTCKTGCGFKSDTPQGIAMHVRHMHPELVPDLKPPNSGRPAHTRKPMTAKFKDGEGKRFEITSPQPPPELKPAVPASAPPHVQTLNGFDHAKKDRKESTKWTDEEKNLVHEEIMRQFQEHPHEGIAIKTVVKAMHIALKDQSRWRVINGRHAAPETFERAEKAVAQLVKNGCNPPPPVERIVSVKVPYEIPVILREAPLPQLAGALAERLMAAYLAKPSSLPQHYQPVPAPVQAPKKLEPAVDAEHVEAMLPKVQVIGFRPNQHTSLVDRFKKKPVIILPSIDPSVPVDPSRLGPKGTIYMVDSTVSTDNWWRHLVDIMSVAPSHRVKHHGPSRVIFHIDELQGKFVHQHPNETKIWLDKQALLGAVV